MQKKQKHRIKTHLSLLFRLGIAGAAMWLILKDIDFAQLADTFRRLQWFVLAAAMLVFAMGQALVGLRWWFVLRAQGIRVPLVPALKLTFIGHFFSQFMPSSVGGDLVRAWYVSRHSEKKLQAALGVAVDRVVGLLSTFLLAAGSYLVFMRGQDLLQFTPEQTAGRGGFDVDFWFPILFSVLFIGAGLILVMAEFRAFRRLARVVYHHSLHFFSQFREVINIYVRHPYLLFSGLLITILLQGLIIVSYWWIGQGLGMDAALGQYLVFFPMVWAFGSIPISVAGIGILEGGVVFLFVTFAGANPETAMALALCQRITWMTAAVPGLIFHLQGSHRGLQGRA